jgi:hypothetical protein
VRLGYHFFWQFQQVAKTGNLDVLGAKLGFSPLENV